MKDIRHQTPSRAFTLVELLVVIAIIGILVSLLLPAVNAAREAARRVQCQNNIRNLVLAVMNYENSRSALPQSSDANSIGSRLLPYSGSQISWIARILPYIEEQALHDQIDFEVGILQQEPTTNGDYWFSRPLSISSCPSDVSDGLLYRSDTYTSNLPAGVGFAKGNYATFVGPEHVECQRVFSGALIAEEQPLRRVKDGTSKTLVVTEVRTRNQEDDQRGAWALAWLGSTILSLDVHSTTTGGAPCQISTPLSLGYQPDADFFEKAQPPNNPVGAWNRDQLRECTNPTQADLLGMPCERESYLSAAPRSQHPGGVNAAQMDGSVLFLSDDIDVATLAALICINDGISTGAVQ